MIAFGPVPSRRLGHSLGINHIPPKHCPYSCVYCQVGRTTALTLKRRVFYPLAQILREVEEKIASSRQLGLPIDYLTLVPDGEPTLDLQLGAIIQSLKQFQIPVAVISNAALIDRPEVREELSAADWVSLKVDTVDDLEWKKINRPQGHLVLSALLNGMMDFKRMFSGTLVTETMLVSGINESQDSLQRLAAYLLKLQPSRSFLSIPTRPPAETWVKSPEAGQLGSILEFFAERVPFMDLLFEAEAADFHSTGSFVDDLLAITAVHPIRERALRKMVEQAGEDWSTVERLVAEARMIAIPYREEVFFLRKHAEK
ncbi:hypothetical protein ADN00_06295 [Ornatilinea apprima]|uniref:Radical SAM core domain-containing protein n=1 Tax=Ornatilinea apprima TaxID=1134406 RepID=A0A0P6X9U3_9CHLR|nr:radical SAM protein [Ornatilinea apprima]KPL78825.1 hypothetical protein ADN00_06295 [Ornatilinea apprima]